MMRKGLAKLGWAGVLFCTLSITRDLPLTWASRLEDINWGPFSLTSQLPVNGAFGLSVSGAGDVNGDGYADVLVSTDASVTGGAIYLFLGNNQEEGLDTAPKIKLALPASDTACKNAAASGKFGPLMTAAGDINGDGYADIVIAATTCTKFFIY